MNRFETTVQACLRVEDIDTLRRKLQVGDTVRYPMPAYKKTDGEWEWGTRIVKAVVVAKYPHLVEVVQKGHTREMPLRTITYVDLLMQGNQGH